LSTIHWLGAGLSSGPGVQRLARGPHPLVLWNRTLERATDLLGQGSSNSTARELELSALAADLAAGDVIVSMLPADWHPRLASLAASKGAHFVSSSYLSEDMLALDAQARAANVCLINEVGLDPGIDHLMTHRLAHRFRNSDASKGGPTVSLRSWCGGFPATPNDFRYKFSWSPVGVLRALRTPARCITAGNVLEVAQPWTAISDYQIPGGSAERFEAYPNRDSLPFIEQYGFDPDWRIHDFVRGTLRLDGWSRAWASIFELLASLHDQPAEETLLEQSERLWQEHSYAAGEADRVVLCVELEAESPRGDRFHEASIIDAQGTSSASAMARLVSLPVSYAVEAVLEGKIDAGVSAAPTHQPIIEDWFDRLAASGDTVIHRRFSE